ncbi:MAG TPA: condensation domain-containing protein, partial [Terriglobales bacterium]|nr:condensation domain-containing protein [Terriglobales bacterium]
MTEDVFPASFGQQGLWFLDQLEPGTAAYNLPRAFRITGPLDVAILTRAFEIVIQRHASLRTVFDSVEGEARQVVLPAVEVKIPVVDLARLPEAEREPEALRIAGEEGKKPFDLREGPLLRPILLSLEPETHFLVLVMHHIIVDGWSIALLFREVTKCYAALTKGEPPELPELPLQYTEYAQWQHEHMTGDVLAREVEYWKGKLAGAQTLLDLPADHPHPATTGWHGSTEEFSLDAATLAKLKGLAQAESSTLFMVAMAAFQSFLWRYTSQESILVGTPVAARNEVEIENMIGLFVNTLVFRADFTNSLSFRSLIRQVRSFALEAYAHQEIPFEKLVEALVPQRSLDVHPLFQVMFTFQNIPKQVFEIPGLKIKEMAFEAGIAKFNLSVEAWEDTEFHCQFEYNTDLFEPSTIRRMLGHFKKLLIAVADNPDLGLAQIPLLGSEERQQVLVEWNQTTADYSRDETLSQAFESQVNRSPEAVALLFAGRKWSYRQLNDEANRLAHRLLQKGVQPGSLVGVFLERSAEMVVALLGVLKAGACYVPLDPAYPLERLRFLIEDASLASTVTHSSIKNRLPDNAHN